MTKTSEEGPCPVMAMHKDFVNVNGHLALPREGEPGKYWKFCGDCGKYMRSDWNALKRHAVVHGPLENAHWVGWNSKPKNCDEEKWMKLLQDPYKVMKKKRSTW